MYAYVGGNPVNFTDPTGLASSCAASWAKGGAIVGGSIVAVGSVAVDAVTGGLNLFATPAEITFGAAVGSTVGYGLGSLVDWLGSPIYNSSESGLGEQKPNDAPSGTLGLDQAGRNYGWDKDTTHGIKDAATGGMAGGKTWVGVAPDGTVGINEGGSWSPQGHYDGLKP